MKKSLEKRLARLEEEHGSQEIGDGLCLIVPPMANSKTGEIGEFDDAVVEAAQRDWHARWHLGIGHAHEMFLLDERAVTDFKRRLDTSLDELEDKTGRRVPVDAYIEYIHTASTTEGATGAAEFFDGVLSCEEADAIWERTVRQEEAK